MSDAVIAHEIEVLARIGCSEAEQAFTQRLLVSVRALTDTRQVAASLNLAEAICYKSICDLANDLAGRRAWTLVEEYSEQLAALLLEQFSSASSVSIQIKKYALRGVAWTGVEITRHQNS